MILSGKISRLKVKKLEGRAMFIDESKQIGGWVGLGVQCKNQVQTFFWDILDWP